MDEDVLISFFSCLWHQAGNWEIEIVRLATAPLSQAAETFGVIWPEKLEQISLVFSTIKEGSPVTRSDSVPVTFLGTSKSRFLFVAPVRLSSNDLILGQLCSKIWSTFLLMTQYSVDMHSKCFTFYCWQNVKYVWLNFFLWTKWLWVQVPLQSLNCHAQFLKFKMQSIVSDLVFTELLWKLTRPLLIFLSKEILQSWK